MELEHSIAHKNALVNQTIGCGGDDGPLVTEIEEQPETVKEKKVKSQTEQFFTSSAMELDSDNEVSIVIPNEIAAQIKSGGYNIILEPITDGGAGAPISYAIISFPNTQVLPESVPQPQESCKTDDPDCEEGQVEKNEGDTLFKQISAA